MPEKQFFENQTVPAKASSVDPTELVSMVKSCIKQSNKHRNKVAILSGSYDKDANKYDELYRGVLYSEREKIPYECKSNLYLYYPNFQAQLLTQLDHKDYVRQVDRERGGLKAEIYERIIRACNYRTNSEEKEYDALILGAKRGNGIIRTTCELDQDGYVWAAERVVDPLNVGISPGATSTEDCSWFYESRPLSIIELKNQYPEYAGQIKPDETVSDNDEYKKYKNGVSVNLIDTITNAVTHLTNWADTWGKGEDKLRAVLTEFWLRDPEEIELEDEQTIQEWIESTPGFGNALSKQKVYENYLKLLIQSQRKSEALKVKRYPFGRKIDVIGTLCVFDEPNPFPFIPFDNWRNFRDANEFWGFSLLGVGRETIQNYHLISSGLAFNTDMRQKPSYYTNDISFNEKKKLKTGPNEMTVLGTPNSYIKAIEGPPLVTDDQLKTMDHRRKETEQVTGLDSILAGYNPAGSYSGQHFEKLLEGSMGRLSERFKELNRMRIGKGNKKLWIIKNYMNEEREMEFATSEEEPILLNQQTINTEIQKQPPFVGGGVQVSNDTRVGNYQYYDEIGANRPVTVQERFREINEIAGTLEKVDPFFAAELKVGETDFPRKWEIIKKLREAGAAQKQREAQMAQLQQQSNQAKMNQAERKMDNEEVSVGSQALIAEAKLMEAQAKVDQLQAQMTAMQSGQTLKEVTGSVGNKDGNGA